MWGPLLFLTLLCLYIGLASCETKCYKNEQLGDAEGNVYHCYGDEKPDCCQQNSEFTCCESNDSKTWKEQAQLWGTVVALVIVIAVLFYCCKTDNTCCNSDDNEPSLAERLGFRKKQEPVLTDLGRAGHSGPMAGTNRNPRYDRLPPLPPVTPYVEHGKAGRDTLYPSLDYRAKSNSGFLDDNDHYDYR